MRKNTQQSEMIEMAIDKHHEIQVKEESVEEEVQEY